MLALLKAYIILPTDITHGQLEDLKYCVITKDFYTLSCKESNDTNLKLWYKRYWKILTDVIKTAKKKYYDELIFKSKNKTKTTWKIIKKKIGNNCHNDIKSLIINNTLSNNPQEIANTFNYYFSTFADTIIRNIKKGDNDSKVNVDHSKYLITNFNSTFSKINWKYATTYEINKILKSLKTKNSYGYDEIPIKILKLNAHFIISPLTYHS